MDINNIWDSVIEYGYDIRKMSINTNKGLDFGQPAWGLLKNKFDKYIFKINDIPNEKINCILEDNGFTYNKNDDKTEIENITINTINLNNDIEHEHFFIQHYRIPILENRELSVKKLMQIAYNIGQFRAEQERKSYPVKQLTYYRDNKLDSLSTYIDHISKLPEGIIDKLKVNLQKASSEK